MAAGSESENSTKREELICDLIRGRLNDELSRTDNLHKNASNTRSIASIIAGSRYEDELLPEVGDTSEVLF